MIKALGKTVPVEVWGKDHWSTFAYLDYEAMNNKGFAKPNRHSMRTNVKTHGAGLGGITPMGTLNDGGKYPTRLKNGELAGHDDWDCIDDAVEAGFLLDVGSSVNRAFTFTKRGNAVMVELNAFKKAGGNFRDFQPSKQALETPNDGSANDTRNGTVTTNA